MLVGVALLVLVALVVCQMRTALGGWRSAALGATGFLVLGSAWGALEWADRRERATPVSLTAPPPVTAQQCFKCHESHYASWQHSFHRTMTREATPENVKADFNDAVHHYQGITSRMTRREDRFFITTVDPEWDMRLANQGTPLEQYGAGPQRKLSVDRLVGSHWFQQLLHRDEEGRYLRLPLAYHLVEKRWIHINGAFLAPSEKRGFWGRTEIWNNNCVLCHNTRPSINPLALKSQALGYHTEVGELGISCEACHGAGERHILAQQNPARRFGERVSGEADPTIVNPAHLSVARSDEVCAHCHGARVPLIEKWDKRSVTDPFLAGRELADAFYLYWSEAEQDRYHHGKAGRADPAERPGPLDGKFWGDGTPLTTGEEYQSMALSACYQGGNGKLRCLTCHTLHGADPNHQLKEGMRTNAACYACHPTYRQQLVEHTHHAADSPGSLCYNCHMPYQVYSLLGTHRSHRIMIPRVRDSVGTGKPHACNLCHLDRSLGWTSEQLARWYHTPPEPLADDDRTFASSVRHLTQSDARTRAVVAAAFSWPPAQQAGVSDWAGPLLMRTLENERYEAVRYLAYRGLRSLYGSKASGYDYEGTPAERAAQLRRIRQALTNSPRLDRGRYPFLPLTASGLFADDLFDRLLRGRNDPDVTVNE